jgi:hypothetical protein
MLPKTLRPLAALALSLPLASCGGDGGGTKVLDQKDGADAAAGGRALYALASRITLPGGIGSTLVAVTDSLAPGAVDTRRTLEIPGFGSAHGHRDVPGALFVGSAESPTFTRYDVSEAGALTKGETFSLAQYGLKAAPRTVVFASPTKAYAIAVESYQIFVWNPQTMTITRAIDLPALKRDGFLPMWVFQAALRDGKLFVPIGWARTGGDAGSAAESAIVTVDVTTDEVAVQEEKRCGGLRAIFKSANGDLFFSSSAGAPVTWRRLHGDRGGSEPCLVRMRAGDTGLDPSYLGRPTALVDSQVPVDFSPAGKSHLVFQALDEALFPVKVDTKDTELWGAPAWRFWSVPITAVTEGAAATATQVKLPPSALNALRFEVDGRNFVPQIKADYSETTVVDVSDPAAVVTGPTIRGSVGNFFRVR